MAEVDRVVGILALLMTAIDGIVAAVVEIEVEIFIGIIMVVHRTEEVQDIVVVHHHHDHIMMTIEDITVEEDLHRQITEVVVGMDLLPIIVEDMLLEIVDGTIDLRGIIIIPDDEMIIIGVMIHVMLEMVVGDMQVEEDGEVTGDIKVLIVVASVEVVVDR